MPLNKQTKSFGQFKNIVTLKSFSLVGWVLRHVNPLGYFMPNTSIGKKMFNADKLLK